MPGLDLGHLGNLIFSARKRCGLTQKELAKQTGLSVKTIESGGSNMVNWDLLAKLNNVQNGEQREERLAKLRPCLKNREG